MGTPISASDRTFAHEERVGLDTSEENKIASSQIKKGLDEYLKQREDLNAAWLKLQEQGKGLFQKQIAFLIKAPTDISDTCRTNSPVGKETGAA